MNSNMNLAFCIFKYYPFGGLERNFLRILEEALRRGHSVTVFTMSWDGEIPEFINEQCNINYIPFTGITNHGKCESFVDNLTPYLKDGNFDLIIGFNRMPGLDLYYSADVCFVADIRRRHSSIYQLTKRYRVFSAFEKSIFSQESKTHILALSKIQRKIYTEEYGTPDNRFHPIPAGIDKEKIRECISQEKRVLFRKKIGINENETMLVMVGSDFKRKGVIRSMEAVFSLPEEIRKRTKLFVLGKGNIKKMLAFAKRLKIIDNIIFPGAVNNVPEYLSAADTLLHPAVSENTGNAIVEALIAGIPVIATSNCGYAFHIENSGAGFVIEGLMFSQNEFNKRLQEAINLPQEQIALWRAKALKYSDLTDFYSRPSVAVDIIEGLKVSS
jgi:UDP-glucose:(heptosyl)LPS alpha-1,3-glucosyltransferase